MFISSNKRGDILLLIKRLLRCRDDRSLPLVEIICDSKGFRAANRLRVDKIRTAGGFCAQPLLRIMKESDRGQTITAKKPD